MSYKTKSYKHGDGWGYKAERKFQADRVERHTIKKKLYAGKTIYREELHELSAYEGSSGPRRDSLYTGRL